MEMVGTCEIRMAVSLSPLLVFEIRSIRMLSHTPTVLDWLHLTEKPCTAVESTRLLYAKSNIEARCNGDNGGVRILTLGEHFLRRRFCSRVEECEVDQYQDLISMHSSTR